MHAGAAVCLAWIVSGNRLRPILEQVHRSAFGEVLSDFVPRGVCEADTLKRFKRINRGSGFPTRRGRLRRIAISHLACDTV
jgi:hypothetical protein